MAQYSIKRRLLIGLLSATAIAWLATLALSYQDARHELDELLDAHLAQSASLLIAQIGHEADDIDSEHAPQLHRYSRNVAFQVWYRGRQLLLHSTGAPNVLLSSQRDGFSDSIIDARQWRVFSATDASGRYLIQVGERREVRDELAETIAESLLFPVLIALPILGALIWFGVARGLRPLNILSDEVSNRQPENLSPLEVEAVPTEILPLVHDLNRLFERVSVTLSKEREFTADAAHELRTPLAAIRTQAQVARAADSQGEQQQALTNVIEGCDRAARIVEQLLTMARLEPEHFNISEKCDLAALARGVIAELAPAAVDKNIEVQLLAEDEANIDGVPALISIMMRNLVDNAIRYSPAGSEVQVSVTPTSAGFEFAVNDQGPGVPPEARTRIWDRFYRVLGTGETGSGLGLSIVKRIVDLHGADAGIQSGAGEIGSRFFVIFSPRARNV